MPTTVTKTIGSAGGRDYSTPQAWEDALPANLVSGDTLQRGECYHDSEFTNSAAIITFGGVTTDATRYPHLTAAAGQSFQDHASVRSNALKYNASNGVACRRTGNYGYIVDVGVDFARVSRIQFKTDGTSEGFTVSGANNGVVFKDIVLHTTGGTRAIDTWSAGTPTMCINVLVIQHGTGDGIRLSNGSAAIGCTVIKPSDVTPSGTGFVSHYGSNVVQSCAVFGFTTASSGGAFDGTNSKFNATNLASGLPGTNNQHNVTYSQFTPFTDADKDSLDLRAISSTSLAANGFRDATNAPNDISATSRTSTPTIGHWELASADTTPPTLGSRAVPTGGVTLTGTLDESCTPSSGTGGFSLSGTAATVASWAIAGGTALTLTLTGTVYDTETVTLSYDRSTTTDDIQDAAGNFLANFSGASVTNNSTQTAPAPSGGSMFRSAVIGRGRML